MLGHLNYFNDTISISQWMNPKLEYYIYMMHKTSYMYFFMYIYCVGGWRSKTKCTVTVHHVQNYRVPLYLIISLQLLWRSLSPTHHTSPPLHCLLWCIRKSQKLLEGSWTILEVLGKIFKSTREGLVQWGLISCIRAPKTAPRPASGALT